MKLKPLTLILSLLASGVAAQNPVNTIYKGSYLGQKPPGNTPEVFVPELFNQFEYLHGKLVFAPDGKEIVWVITTQDKGVDIFKSFFLRQKADGSWSTPEESFLSHERKENGPCYSSDGNRLYYQSRSPLNGIGENKDINIWYRERIEQDWREPKSSGKPVNSDADESQPWITHDGSLLFCRDNPKSESGDKGGSDIFYSSFTKGGYSEPNCLGAEINSAYHDTEPTMAPDGSYMVFISNRPGGYSRGMNLYISFRTPAGGWTKAYCLSLDFKIDNIWFPTISYDGKYLFFCGGHVTEHGYNNSNYYWVSTDGIYNLNPYKKSVAN